LKRRSINFENKVNTNVYRRGASLSKSTKKLKGKLYPLILLYITIKYNIWWQKGCTLII